MTHFESFIYFIGALYQCFRDKSEVSRVHLNTAYALFDKEVDMKKLVYLFELDSVRNSDEEIIVAQKALYNEIVHNGNIVVLTYNQLVDSRGFFSLLNNEKYYNDLLSLFKKGAIRISQYGDVRTIAQYLINSVSSDRKFIYSGWPLKSTQKCLLALIKRSLIYSDLIEINDYVNGGRTDREVLDLFVEVIERKPIPTSLSLQQCRNILKNLSEFIKTVLRLSSLNTIYVKPKPDDKYHMTLPKYIHYILTITSLPHGECMQTLWREAKDVLHDTYKIVNKKNGDVFEFDYDSDSTDRSDYHHAIQELYETASKGNEAVTQEKFLFASLIIDLCYNYQLEYSVCNSSKHYNLSELEQFSPQEWITFSADFFRRLEQGWNNGEFYKNRINHETNEYEVFNQANSIPDFSKAVRLLTYLGDEEDVPAENIHRYEYHIEQQKQERKNAILSSIRKKVLLTIICFIIALASEMLFEFTQEMTTDLIGRWINIDSLIWRGLNIVIETIFVLTITEYITSIIAKYCPGFMQLSDALKEFIYLYKDRKSIRQFEKLGNKSQYPESSIDVDVAESYQSGLTIKCILSVAMKKYIHKTKAYQEWFSESCVYPIGNFSDGDREFNIMKLCILEELYGHHFGVVYESKYNTLVVDPIRRICEIANECDIEPYFPYERIIPVNNDGVVMVTKHNDNFLLLRQFRHAIRREQYGFPRGFAEHDSTPEENAVRELQEEIGASVTKTPILLGRIAPDSGLTGSCASVFIVEVDEFRFSLGHEGIKEIIELTETELVEMIAKSEIDDGITLAAYQLYKTYVEFS